MVDTAFENCEDVTANGKKPQEPIVMTEEKLYSSDVFRMNCFKVLPCCKLYNHNWKTCPFLHEGEKAGRRDPQKYRYVGIECQEAKKGECPRGESCPYAHNLFEFWLHPSRYRTQLCNKPSACRRKVCFFAHSVKELRHPSMSAVEMDTCSRFSVNGSELSSTEEPRHDEETASSESSHTKGQMTSQSPPLPDGMIPPFPSASCHDRSFSSPVSFLSHRSASAHLSPVCSPIPPTVPSGILLKKTHSTISPISDTPTPARMSPMIHAYRSSFDCLGDRESGSPLGSFQDSVLIDAAMKCREACIWKADFASSDSSLKNVNWVADDGDI